MKKIGSLSSQNASLKPRTSKVPSQRKLESHVAAVAVLDHADVLDHARFEGHVPAKEEPAGDRIIMRRIIQRRIGSGEGRVELVHKEQFAPIKGLPRSPAIDHSPQI